MGSEARQLINMNIEIIHKPTAAKPFLVIYKPKGLPSAPLNSEDSQNALSQAAAMYPEIKSVCGKKAIEYGLVHRLDTATDGLMVIAASQECYNFLIAEQAEGCIIKYYSAQCDVLPENANKLGGFPPDIPEAGSADKTSITASSFFRPYGEGRKEVRPVTEKSGKAALSKLGKQKLYTTQISITKNDGTTAFAECRITEGYRHQVRCHLAWAGFPVKGDLLYNSIYKTESELSDKKKAENLLFSATKISFEYPRGDLNSYDRKDTWT